VLNDRVLATQAEALLLDELLRSQVTVSNGEAFVQIDTSLSIVTPMAEKQRIIE
jgi:hypothetical protein